VNDLELYERRTYDVSVGQMGKVLELYSNEGWPALEAGGHSKFLVGYFVSDTGPLHQLIHIWRFSSDAERRDFWRNLYADDTFMAFASQLRPLLERQEIQLMQAAPWGPRP
jgi:hypothetical protein